MGKTGYVDDETGNSQTLPNCGSSRRLTPQAGEGGAQIRSMTCGASVLHCYSCNLRPERIQDLLGYVNVAIMFHTCSHVLQRMGRMPPGPWRELCV